MKWFRRVIQEFIRIQIVGNKSECNKVWNEQLLLTASNSPI